MDKRIYLCLAHMSGKEQAFIKEAFDTNWVVPLGPNVNAFEDELKHFVGQDKEVVALSAGTAAIHLGLIQLGVGAGDEVICQSFTFCASANPVAYQEMCIRDRFLSFTWKLEIAVRTKIFLKRQIVAL